jgi:hypothetical protein
MHIHDVAVRAERVAQRLLGGVKSKITNVQTISHVHFSIIGPRLSLCGGACAVQR